MKGLAFALGDAGEDGTEVDVAAALRAVVDEEVDSWDSEYWRNEDSEGNNSGEGRHLGQTIWWPMAMDSWR